MRDITPKSIKKITKYFCLIVIVLYFLLNVGIRINLLDSGGCISVAFDKWDMMNADKVVICVREESYTITDVDFVRKISSETAVATNTDLSCSKTDDRWIELYRDNRLIRCMRWNTCCDNVIVYQADNVHWILFGQSKEKNGFVKLSDELLDMLYAVMEVK